MTGIQVGLTLGGVAVLYVLAARFMLNFTAPDHLSQPSTKAPEPTFYEGTFEKDGVLLNAVHQATDPDDFVAQIEEWQGPVSFKSIKKTATPYWHG